VDTAGCGPFWLEKRVAVRHVLRCLGLALSLVFSGAGAHAGEAASPSEQLVNLINAHRAEQGLSAVPVSPSLNRVALAHVQDLELNRPGGQCNGHSWSAAGPWTPCCYTADHAQSQCMWDKPKEITRGVYSSTGFEIVFWAGRRATPEDAMARWMASAGHQSVLLNRGIWVRSHWKAMGVAISAHHAVAWFGEEPDSGAPR
jgi:hypothetical protein